MCQKYGFSNLKKNLFIIFCWICSIIKKFCYLLCSWTNPLFGKNLVREIEAKNTLSQSGCRIFKSSISSEQINETVLFLACWYKFKTINSWWNIFSWVWSKMGLIKNGFQKSDLWTVSQEWTDGIDTDSQKLKADQNFVRWVWSKLGLANLVTGL